MYCPTLIFWAKKTARIEENANVTTLFLYN